MSISIYLPFIIFAVVCVALASTFVFFRVKEGASPKALVFKTLASLVFVGGGLYALCLQKTIHSANVLIVLGLMLAMVGDIFIDLRHIHLDKEKYYLNAGITAFSLSFLSMAVAVVLLCKDLTKFWFLLGGSLIIAALVTTINLLIEKPMKLDYKSFRVQVSVFAFIESFVAVLSLGICLYIGGFAIFAVGAILCLAGDMVLSQYLFKSSKHEKLLIILNHILYYAGEILIMAYLFFQLM